MDGKQKKEYHDLFNNMLTNCASIMTETFNISFHDDQQFKIAFLCLGLVCLLVVLDLNVCQQDPDSLQNPAKDGTHSGSPTSTHQKVRAGGTAW